jgi:DNA topoisomerase-3
MGLAYVCEHSVAKPKTCDFRSGRIILQQEILPEQMAKLLNDGKTDLLPGFISQRTRRPFKAFLTRGKDGKISFEFEERKAKAPAKGKAAAAIRRRGADEGAAAASQKPAAKKPRRQGGCSEEACGQESAGQESRRQKRGSGRALAQSSLRNLATLRQCPT